MRVLTCKVSDATEDGGARVPELNGYYHQMYTYLLGRLPFDGSETTECTWHLSSWRVIFPDACRAYTGLISSDSIQITAHTHSLYHFENPAILAIKTDIWLQFENDEKNPPVIQKNKKQILKSWYFYYWCAPKGCQKMRQYLLNMPLEVWCAKIAPKLKNIQECLRKQGFFEKKFQLWPFLKFVPFFGQS